MKENEERRKDLNEEKLILMNKLCGVFRTPRLPASPAPHLCLRYGGEQLEAIIALPFLRMRRETRAILLCVTVNKKRQNKPHLK